jgi:hypothetical protein
MISKYRQQIKDSAYTSIVVGTMLVFINHLQAILSFTFTSVDLLHWSLNFVIPFMVSLYSRVSALKKAERSSKNY